MQRMGDAPQNGGGMLFAALIARSALMRYSRSLARVRFRLGIISPRAGLGRDSAGASGSGGVVVTQRGNRRLLSGLVV